MHCWSLVGAVPPPPWTDADISIGFAGGRYEGALRDIVHAFKYEGRRSLARPLAHMMRDVGATALLDADCVVPVPLHAWRRLTRGFNQAVDLASALEKPVVHALWRKRATRPQIALAARSRRTNVRNAFVLSPLLGRAAALHGRPRIDDRIVVLIDDVRTTGATLNACAQVLKQGGAREVRALTVAIADAPTPVVAYSRVLTSV